MVMVCNGNSIGNKWQSYIAMVSAIVTGVARVTVITTNSDAICNKIVKAVPLQMVMAELTLLQITNAIVLLM